MSDDIFSKLFELFDQPGPINWKLAAEVARSITGDRVPVEPWVAEEYRELARLVEYRLESVSPFHITPALDVTPVDSREWAETHLESYGRIVEPFGDSVAGEGPAAPLMSQLKPAMIGLQVGSLVGSLSTSPPSIPESRRTVPVPLRSSRQMSTNSLPPPMWTRKKSVSGSSPARWHSGSWVRSHGSRTTSPPLSSDTQAQ
jgi:hypothetical protein